MNALTTTATNPSLALLMDPARFDHLQRVATMIAMSPLFPEHLRKGDKNSAIANAALVLNMANRLNEDPLTVAQNIYFVGGKPGWNTTYMISKANMHGVFKGPIDWEITGEGKTLSVTAFAILSSTGRRVQATCGMVMAEAEGWVKNPKYKSMPTQMLSYRSAAFLIRLYCPEVMIGVPAAIEVELETMRDVTPVQTGLDAHLAAAFKSSQEKSEAKQAPPEPDPEPPVDEAETSEEQDSDDDAAMTPANWHAKAEYDHRTTYNSITGDLIEGAPPEGTKTHWADAIEAMRVEDPERHAKLMAEFAAFES